MFLVVCASTAQITSSVHIEAKDEKGNIISIVDSPASPATVRPPEIQYFLQDWEEDDIPLFANMTWRN